MDGEGKDIRLEGDTLVAGGCRYNLEFFTWLSSPATEGKMFRVVHRNKQIIFEQVIYDERFGLSSKTDLREEEG